MNFTDFIICALAASAIVDVWFNGSILADIRALVEVRADWCDDLANTDAVQPLPEDSTSESLDTWVNCLPCIVTQLLNCAYCMAHHTPLWVIAWYLSAGCFPTVIATALRIPVYALACTRLMNLVTTMSGKPYQDTK